MVPIEAVSVCAYKVPTESPESDGTLEWNATTTVYVEIRSGGVTGIGYPHGSAAVARFIEDGLRELYADRGANRNDAQPERRFAEDPQVRRERIVGRGYLTLAVIGAVVAGAAAGFALRQRKR